ncbi:Allophanate hydrolase 2 subunit 1 [Salmonella enterica subsp. arizonae]|uniref:Allophanate hydrolase 2 subunit 1 n=1 Tax=Salmonella enterica subsp. arizonae TaxID=59203 RepID=A0A379SYZ7_SALER|nr:Allophanate hydrolase 2 subunit 1 [Salmonella enterica subsp. arizonae]
MQRARCYLLGETAVVLELEPPITLASQKRIWRLTQRLVDMPNVRGSDSWDEQYHRNPAGTANPGAGMRLNVCSAGGKRARRWSRTRVRLRSR